MFFFIYSDSIKERFEKDLIWQLKISKFSFSTNFVCLSFNLIVVTTGYFGGTQQINDYCDLDVIKTSFYKNIYHYLTANQFFLRFSLEDTCTPNAAACFSKLNELDFVLLFTPFSNLKNNDAYKKFSSIFFPIGFL